MSISFIKFGKTSFKGNLAEMKDRYTSAEVGSKYLSKGLSTSCATSGNVWQALKLFKGFGTRPCFVGKTKDGYVAELESTDGKVTEVVRLQITRDNSITVFAGTIDNEVAKSGSVVISPNYLLWSKMNPVGFSGTVVLLALMDKILSDDEANERANALEEYLDKADDAEYWKETKDGNLVNLSEFSKAEAGFVDNVYRRIVNETIDAKAKLTLPKEQSDIKGLRQSDLKIRITANLCGTPKYFQSVGAVSADDTALSPYLLKTDYTEKEKSLIPTMKKGYIVPEWTTNICKYIYHSTKYSEPIRTAYLVGTSGCGKTQGAMSMAQQLGLAYEHITCSPDMEIIDFLGQIFPNTNPTSKISFEDVRKELGLPSVEDICMDLESAYIALFHSEMPEDTQEADVICEMISRVNGAIAEMCNTKDYTYVEGGLVKALRYGYLFEVQEIGIVKRAGVAVGLNAILESGCGASLTLPTGEKITKHPNCVIVFTSNDEYEGTSNLNQSVLSRMGHVEYFKNASSDEMAKRTLSFFDKEDRDFLNSLKVTDGKSEIPLVTRCAKIIENISDFCKDKGISDGVCGQRELNNWIMEILIDMRMEELTEVDESIIRETCQKTVLNKVAQNVEDIEDVAIGCVNAYFGEMEVRI